MTAKSTSTRRAVLKGGALLATPLAVLPAGAMADDGRAARLARLEDESAIRALHEAWLRRINAGAGEDAALIFTDRRGAGADETVRRIAADHAGEPDVIEITADGENASGRFQCAVEIESMIAPDCTPARMAHAQGGGFIRRTERRVLKADYVKAGGAWTIAKVELATV